MNTHPNHIPQPPYYEEDEVTLKDIILTIKDYSFELLKNVHWIILSALLLTGAFYYVFRGSANKTTFTGGMSFLLKKNNEQNATGAPPDFLQASEGNDKLSELAKSGSVINAVLLEKITIKEEHDYMANHLIKTYGYNYRWNNEPIDEDYQELSLRDFYFTHDSIEIFEPREYRALNTLRDLLIGSNITNARGILSIAFNKGSGITRLQVVSPNDKLSIELVDLIFEKLKALYTEGTIGRAQRNFELLVDRVEELEKERREAKYRLAGASDQTYGLVSKASALNIGELQEELNRVNQMYQNIYNQKQAAEVAIKTNAPDFLVIDRNFLPVKKTTSIKMQLIMGAILGLFLGVGFVIFRKLIRDALAD